MLKQLKELSKAQKHFVAEVITLTKLILVTNAVSQRSFSAQRRLLSYLRTTIKQNRLNHAMLLHIYKEKTDALFMIDIANEFVGYSEHRYRKFGRFADIDLRR